MKNAYAFLLMLAAAAFLGGCDSDSKPPNQKVRPVLSAVAERQVGASCLFCRDDRAPLQRKPRVSCSGPCHRRAMSTPVTA